MKKKLFQKLFLCAILINAIMVGTITAASVPKEQEISEMQEIKPYAQILDKLNQELGTEFAFPTNDVLERSGMDRSEVIEHIKSTEIEDYEQLIRNEYLRVHEDLSDNLQVELMTTTQKAFYSGANYISISAATYYADGETRYSSISSYSYGYSSTPFYKPISYNADLLLSNTMYSCVFTCYKMLDASVSYDSWKNHYIQACFYAGGGDTTGEILS